MRKTNTVKQKEKVGPITSMMDGTDGNRGMSVLSLTSALRRGWVVKTESRSLYPQEWSGTHCTEDWVDPRAGLDGYGKSRPHRDSIPGTSSP